MTGDIIDPGGFWPRPWMALEIRYYEETQRNDGPSISKGLTSLSDSLAPGLRMEVRAGSPLLNLRFRFGRERPLRVWLK